MLAIVYFINYNENTKNIDVKMQKESRYMSKYYLGIDVGGTDIKVGVIRDD